MSETREIIDDLKKRHVRFLLLQFTDLLGVNKAVEVPASQFDKALAGEVSFDGSALEGFARVEEADALLVPDLASFRVFPWESGGDDVAHGQHEIALGAGDPLTLADHLATLRFVVRTIAVRHGLVATFMPKPIYGRNGSGMHTHQSLFAKGKNAFFDPKGPIQLSEVGRR